MTTDEKSPAAPDAHLDRAGGQEATKSRWETPTVTSLSVLETEGAPLPGPIETTFGALGS